MPNLQTQEEIIRLLPKGMLTIPKAIRLALGLKSSQRPLLRLVILDKGFYVEQVEIVPSSSFRSYTNEEVKRFLKEDKLEAKLARKVERLILQWKRNSG